MAIPLGNNPLGEKSTRQLDEIKFQLFFVPPPYGLNGISDRFYGSPPQKTNVFLERTFHHHQSWLLDTRKDAMKKKSSHIVLFVQRTSNQTMTSGWQRKKGGTVYEEKRPGAGFETGDFVKYCLVCAKDHQTMTSGWQRKVAPCTRRTARGWFRNRRFRSIKYSSWGGYRRATPVRRMTIYGPKSPSVKPSPVEPGRHSKG